MSSSHSLISSTVVVSLYYIQCNSVGIHKRPHGNHTQHDNMLNSYAHIGIQYGSFLLIIYASLTAITVIYIFAVSQILKARALVFRNIFSQKKRCFVSHIISQPILDQQRSTHTMRKYCEQIYLFCRCSE